MLTIHLLSFLGRAYPQEIEMRSNPNHQSPRLVFVIDVSGSMRGSKIQEAMDLAIQAAERPTDDLELGIFTFDWSYTRLVDNSDPENPSNWFTLPSANAINARRDQLRSFPGNGPTNPGTALVNAFAERTDTVVLVTDGLFNTRSVINTINKAREVRREAELKRVHFVVVGVGCSRVSRQNLQRIADETSGQFLEPNPPPEPEEPEVVVPPRVYTPTPPNKPQQPESQKPNKP